ncbi:MAG: hypothetical protein AAB116_19120, partial [Candidatus Poribacteria bacterium]
RFFAALRMTYLNWKMVLLTKIRLQVKGILMYNILYLYPKLVEKGVHRRVVHKRVCPNVTRDSFN